MDVVAFEFAGFKGRPPYFQHVPHLPGEWSARLQKQTDEEDNIPVIYLTVRLEHSAGIEDRVQESRLSGSEIPVSWMVYDPPSYIHVWFCKVCALNWELLERTTTVHETDEEGNCAHYERWAHIIEVQFLCTTHPRFITRPA